MKKKPELKEESKDFIDEIQKITSLAAAKARASAFEAGLSVCYIKDGVIVREYKDGTIEKI